MKHDGELVRSTIVLLLMAAVIGGSAFTLHQRNSEKELAISQCVLKVAPHINSAYDYCEAGFNVYLKGKSN